MMPQSSLIKSTGKCTQIIVLLHRGKPPRSDLGENHSMGTTHFEKSADFNRGFTLPQIYNFPIIEALMECCTILVDFSMLTSVLLPPDEVLIPFFLTTKPFSDWIASNIFVRFSWNHFCGSNFHCLSKNGYHPQKIPWLLEYISLLYLWLIYSILR